MNSDILLYTFQMFMNLYKNVSSISIIDINAEWQQSVSGLNAVVWSCTCN